MMRTLSVRSVIPLIVVILLLVGSCSTEATDTTTTTVDAAVTTTELVVTTTIVGPTTTTMSPSDDDVVVAKDIVFLEMDGNEYLVDVYAPAGDGPWPVVVVFHLGGFFKEHPTNTLVARAAVEAGMVVFAPNFVAEWPPVWSDEDVAFHRSVKSASRCALAFAQQEASGYGGDPNRTVTYGFSAGVGPAATLALGPEAEPTPGCLAQTPPIRPVGAVLGDGQYFYHAQWVDAAFDADPEGMQALAAEIIDPASWPVDLSARFRLWAADPGTRQRTFDDPWDEDGWFAQRDPDGTIRQDLDELSELDDGIISNQDEGLLLATRLQQAGIDATIDSLPGRHTTIDKVPELVAYLLDAAGTE